MRSTRRLSFGLPSLSIRADRRSIAILGLDLGSRGERYLGVSAALDSPRAPLLTIHSEGAALEPDMEPIGYFDGTLQSMFAAPFRPVISMATGITSVNEQRRALDSSLMRE